MSSVKVKATIVEDNTGIKSQLPILITEQGEVGSVTDYLLKMEADGASNALMNGFIQATSLLLDYMEANKGLFEDPKMLFQTFAKRLYTGTIGEDGLVTALFENGDIRPVFKIPVATFPNPAGLGANTGNVFTQTDFSGLFFLRTAGTGGAGKVQNSVLEASTVDIAKEFTQMITTQRAFSASAKILSTADEMLNDLVRIKR